MIFKCAIVGCGNIAGGYDSEIPANWSLTHAGAYHLCQNTNLIAVADANEESLKKFGEKWNIGRLYTDYEKMLEDEDIDILSLCLPTAEHFNAFQFACKKNIPAIFCEKPLSYDLNEAEEMVEMSRGRVVSVNYFRRWNSTLSQVREEIRRGDYGRVINVTSRYTKGIFVNGSHIVDLIRWFLGEPEEVTLIKLHQTDVEDPGVDFVLTFKNNITSCFLNVTDAEYVFIDVDILTEKGRLVIGQRGQYLIKYHITSEPYYQKFSILKQIEETETDWRNCPTRAIREIVDCLETGDQTSCTPVDGLRVMEICRKVVSQET
ncbi:MAG: Gfo/Idh/MocA family oxidoreductase [Candidatus Scalindua sp.]|jgi:predicted dehydrogenase|nr:Gfo/Idh/MocA family oxidoreductase [Candidatus Scalindua sp.]